LTFQDKKLISEQEVKRSVATKVLPGLNCW